MTHDPLRRRFGHGAARLPIGSSTHGPSLSQLAQRRVPRERFFAGMPAGVCVTLAALLFLAMQIDLADPTLVVPRALSPEIAQLNEPLPPLEIEFWEESVVPPAAKEPVATPEPVVIAATEQAPPASEPDALPLNADQTRSAENERAPRFDPARLALRAPSAAPLTEDLLLTPAPRTKAAPRPGAPTSARIPRPRIDLPTRGQTAPPSALTAQAASPSPRPSARPTSGSNAGSPDLKAADWSANADQRAFLIARADAVANASSSGGAAANARSRLSPVSAAAETRAKADRIRDELVAGGWQQVPLDTLPDCSPAGRQDELKRSILRAAPYDRTCADQHGSFRFVETSNLGAFLMWSRTNPDAFARTGRDRDACVVLERALRCLTKSSNQEL